MSSIGKISLFAITPTIDADVESKARFLQEARTASNITHENIISVYDFGEDQGVRFAVTELLHGATLRERITRERLAWRKVVEIGTAIADVILLIVVAWFRWRHRGPN